MLFCLSQQLHATTGVNKTPPAGNQVVPTLENVASFDFEPVEGAEGLSAFKLFTNTPGTLPPTIVEDEFKGNVLELNNGFMTISNPLAKVTLQKGASFTFWMMQPIVTEADEEGNEIAMPQNLDGSLLRFENETGNGSFSLNANGGFVYEAADGEWIENDPSQITTGYLKPGEWHYVAVVISNDGYDGM